MTERPIIFSAPMVRAILDGRKTQTRREVKPQPPSGHHFAGWCVCSTHRADEGKAAWAAGTYPHLRGAHRVACPYGQLGDLLWVRETFYHDPEDSLTLYRADDEFDGDQCDAGYKWQPSMHMPRTLSRIKLEITGVRVERLQDISEADAIEEGAPPSHPSINAISREFGYTDFPRSWFAQLWDSINGPGSWDTNPWVWMIEFRRIKP